MRRLLPAVPLELPATFAFTQSSLQSFANCRRRFWLSYVKRVPWPAMEVAPYDEHEELLRLGGRFHQLVERAEAGIPADLLSRGLTHPLDEWFASYLRSRPADLPDAVVEVESVLSAPLEAGPASYRLAARYDLLAVGGEGAGRRAVIVDWKTNDRVPSRAQLQNRLQSLVYPYVLVEASPGLPWGPVEPEQVEMRYWFTAAPEDPVTFRYSSALHAANRAALTEMLAEMCSGESEREFPKVDDTDANRRRYCSYCIYRSRCDRGVGAGRLGEFDEEEFLEMDLESALEFTLEEVQELAF